jgi:adenylate cyclase
VEIPRVQRRQATVLNADVVGYSRMMADNDLRTVESLLESLARIAQQVSDHGGRVVDSVGDNLMAEFPSELAALRCAIAVQRNMVALQREQLASERLQFRIGLHSGSLLAIGERIYGDVVNLASRFQAAANPGQVVVSESVAGRAGSLQKQLFDRGLQYFKNIPQALRTFEVEPEVCV